MADQSKTLRIAALAVLAGGGMLSLLLINTGPTPRTDVPWYRPDLTADQVTALISLTRRVYAGWAVLALSVLAAAVILFVDLVRAGRPQVPAHVPAEWVAGPGRQPVASTR